MDQEEYNLIGHLASQVFSNHLLLKTIWRYFSVETLNTLSLVCRDFCAISRKVLRDHHITTLGISISFDGPCQRLEIAEEIIRNSKDSPYNSIALFKPKKCRSFYFSCSNNCREGNLEVMYPSILQCDKWKSIGIFVPYHCDQNCPSLKLFWMLIFQNAKSVKKLCFTGNATVIRKNLDDYIKTNGTDNKPCFPELEFLEIGTTCANIVNPFLLSSPKLTVIRGSIFLQHLMNSNFCSPCIPKDKWGMFTCSEVARPQELMTLAACGIRLEKLKIMNGMVSMFWPEDTQDFQTSLTLPQQMFTKTLTKLSTWCRNAAFIATRATEPLLKLESLSLGYYRSSCPDPPLISMRQCTLGAIDFDRAFPRLRKMTIKYLQLENAFLSREVSLRPGLYKSSSVTHLKIIHKLSEDCLAEIARMFPSVEILEVVDITYVSVASRQDLQKIFRFWGISGNFRRLKTVRLVCSLPAVSFDDYMGYVECGKTIGDLDCRWKFTLASKQFSVFNKNHLRSIEIHVRNCRSSVLTHDEASNILSIRAAKMIGANLPGFMVILRFPCRCKRCNQIDETYFQHLRPFSTISHSLSVHGLLEIKIIFGNKSLKM